MNFSSADCSNRFCPRLTYTLSLPCQIFDSSSKSDEELFEDDPREYIVTEVEGSDSESRRRCSQDLLRSMCRQFEAQTTAICSEHIGVMLNDYGQNPDSKWAMKDAAVSFYIYLNGFPAEFPNGYLIHRAPSTDSTYDGH